MTARESLRTYAKRYKELATSDEQAQKRALWRSLNAKKRVYPPIYVRAIPYGEFFDTRLIRSEDPLLRSIETDLAQKVLYHRLLGDDFIFEPWVMLRASTESNQERWGVRCSLGEKPKSNGAAAFHPAILGEEDIDSIQPPRHVVDEIETAKRIERVEDAIGDILPVYADRRGVFARAWRNDIASDLTLLRGMDNMLYDFYDHPEWLHKLLARLRDGILQNLDETEAAGDLTLACHENQAMSYTDDLEDPDPSVRAVSLDRLWCHSAAQEFTLVNTPMFEEFMLNYQLPILKRFALCAYGCCEDLTNKIDALRRIPNLRRIAVAPAAHVARCAERIGKDYVISYRPNPSEIISLGYDEARVRALLRRDFDILRRNDCIFDVTIKDVETIRARPDHYTRLIFVVREEIERATCR